MNTNANDSKKMADKKTTGKSSTKNSETGKAVKKSPGKK